MPVALAVLAGLALLATGLPRAGAGLAAVPALEAVQPGAAGWLDESRLHAALAGRAEGVAAQPTADDHARLAYLSGVVAGRAADAATRAARLADGRRHAEAAVLAGPADPYHWLMLADAEVRRAGVGAAAVGAIAMSFAPAPQRRGPLPGPVRAAVAYRHRPGRRSPRPPSGRSCRWPLHGA